MTRTVGNDHRATGDDEVPQGLTDAGLSAGIETALAVYLEERAVEATAIDPAFSRATESLADFVLTGGKRIRPTFAWWGWRGSGRRGRLAGGRRRAQGDQRPRAAPGRRADP